ncbi:MAG: ornithine cyclodeaminase [Lachnospiraceae bacterium]|nr:ornithine cyclodeaminase [Lachnospiraceae bacterium]
MKLVTYEDIRKLNIAPGDCYQWVSEMIADKKSVDLPAKISMKPFDGVFCNVMPCIISNSVLGRIGGVKIVTRYPERIPSLDSKLLLFDADSGEFLALMDANWITAMRTGAVAAHSIMLFGKKNFSEIGMLGLGNTARAALLVLTDVIADREVKIKLLKYKGQEEAFAQRFSGYQNLQFTYVEDSGKLVRGSEVIISAATYFEQDICSDDCFDEGILVVPIHTRGFSNCDLFFDKVYADDYSHVKHFKNFSKFRSFAEVSDVVAGNAVGRENNKERILAYNIGVSMHDINFAAHIYQLLKDESGMIDIDMKEPVNKFWI